MYNDLGWVAATLAAPNQPHWKVDGSRARFPLPTRVRMRSICICRLRSTAFFLADLGRSYDRNPSRDARPFIQRTHRLCPRPNDVLGTNRFAKFWPNLVTGCAVLFHNRDHEMRDASQGSSCSMNDDNDVFRREFRASLSMIADALDRLNALVGEKATSTEHELREQVAESEKLIDQSRMQARAAQNELNRLIEEQQLETSEKIADWKTHRQTSKLHARADRWERSAATAIEIAILAIDEAERAVLCALLTRKETISIQIQRR